MLTESTVDAVKRRLVAVMDDRVGVFAVESGRIITTAAAQGLINSPETHQEVAGIVRQEYQTRATLCADALAALVDGADPASAVAAGVQLKTLVAEVLDASVDDLARIHRGFAGLPGAAERMIPLQQCRDQAVGAAEDRVDAAVSRCAGTAAAS